MGDHPPTIEQAFELLQEGKALEKKSDFWNAADKFVQGREILSSLAIAQPQGTIEEQKIAQLYLQKSKEYLDQSRQCLIGALQQETATPTKDSTFYENLSDEEARLRIQTFYKLFARKVDFEPDQAGVETSPEDQQRSIEDRLQELNASLPSGFKTDQERMDGIHRGLNRLGLSLYTQKKPFQSFQDTLPKSEDEQIEEIIHQATDEVAFQKKFGNPTSVSDPTKSNYYDDDEDEESDEMEDDEDIDEDLDLDDEELAIKHIRQRVVKAQVKLAELIACLDEAKLSKHKENDSDIEVGDSDSDADKGQRASTDILASGKKKLIGARRDLNKALEEWKEVLLIQN